jgi:hypothetical protein
MGQTPSVNDWLRGRSKGKNVDVERIDAAMSRAVSLPSGTLLFRGFSTGRAFNPHSAALHGLSLDRLRGCARDGWSAERCVLGSNVGHIRRLCGESFAMQRIFLKVLCVGPQTRRAASPEALELRRTWTALNPLVSQTK